MDACYKESSVGCFIPIPERLRAKLARGIFLDRQ